VDARLWQRAIWHLIYSVPDEREMRKTLELAQHRRAGWVYVTDDGPDGNPWDDVPSYWAAEARDVSLYKGFAPTCTRLSSLLHRHGRSIKVVAKRQMNQTYPQQIP
jgi:hypothetical protein